jgi:hypothetical protein
MTTSEIFNNAFVNALNAEIAYNLNEMMDNDKLLNHENFICDDEGIFIDTITVDNKEYPVGMQINMEAWVDDVQFDESRVDDFNTKLWIGGFEINEGYENDFKTVNEIIKEQTGKTIVEILKMKSTAESIINDYQLNEQIYEVLDEYAEPDEVCFDDDLDNGWKF